MSDDTPGDDPDPESQFVFERGPEAFGEQGPPNNVDFTVENQGTTVTLTSFRVDVSGDRQRPSEFDEYEITTPPEASIEASGDFEVNERTEHDAYEIGPDETSTYEVREFNTNNMNGVLNNESVYFDIVLIDQDGSEYPVSD